MMNCRGYEKPAIIEERLLEKELFFACIFQNRKKCEPICHNPGQSEGQPC